MAVTEGGIDERFPCGEALTALFGESVKGLSQATAARLKDGCERECAAQRERVGTIALAVSRA
ncbi:MAG: hypothetical protein OXH94_17065 [Rhodospirillales bacterium]|nr:hypothetical protein [Rhodospirillales bacterium]